MVGTERNRTTPKRPRRETEGRSEWGDPLVHRTDYRDDGRTQGRPDIPMVQSHTREDPDLQGPRRESRFTMAMTTVLLAKGLLVHEVGPLLRFPPWSGRVHRCATEPRPPSSNGVEKEPRDTNGRCVRYSSGRDTSSLSSVQYTDKVDRLQRKSSV